EPTGPRFATARMTAVPTFSALVLNSGNRNRHERRLDRTECLTGRHRGTLNNRDLRDFHHLPRLQLDIFAGGATVCVGLYRGFEPFAVRLVPYAETQALDVLDSFDLQRGCFQFGTVDRAPERPTAAGRAVGRKRRKVLSDYQLYPAPHCL